MASAGTSVGILCRRRQGSSRRRGAVPRRVAALLLAIPLALLILMGAGLSLAQAHASVRESQPAPHATVKGPVVEVRVRFNARIDPRRSRLVLHRAGTSDHTLSLKDVGEPATLAATAPGLTPGAYVLRWQVLALDGHITRGEIPFTVGR